MLLCIIVKTVDSARIPCVVYLGSVIPLHLKICMAMLTDNSTIMSFYRVMQSRNRPPSMIIGHIGHIH